MAVESLVDIDVLVLDIEGTVCPISFVHDVLFPYALDALARRLDGFWDSPDFASYRDAFPERYRRDRDAFEAHVRHLVAQDIKAPYLKALQGYLWRQGYESGDLVAPVFPDVGHFIRTAQVAGKKIIVYSSGSVPAQKLFFSHGFTAIGPDALHLGLVRYRQRRPQDRLPATWPFCPVAQVLPRPAGCS